MIITSRDTLSKQLGCVPWSIYYALGDRRLVVGTDVTMTTMPSHTTDIPINDTASSHDWLAPNQLRQRDPIWHTMIRPGGIAAGTTSLTSHPQPPPDRLAQPADEAIHRRSNGRSITVGSYIVGSLALSLTLSLYLKTLAYTSLKLHCQFKGMMEKLCSWLLDTIVQFWNVLSAVVMGKRLENYVAIPFVCHASNCWDSCSIITQPPSLIPIIPYFVFRCPYCPTLSPPTNFEVNIFLFSRDIVVRIFWSSMFFSRSS